MATVSALAPPPVTGSALPALNMPWIESPFLNTLLATSGLDARSRALVESFARDGYAIVDPELGDVDAICRGVISGLEPRFAGAGRLQDAWHYNPDVKKIALTPRVLSDLRTLYGREPIPFQTLNFPRGTEQATHSDTIHFSSMPPRFMCAVWVALEDIDAENGPLHYYPGSHKLPLLDYTDLGIGDGRPPAGPAWRASFLSAPRPLARGLRWPRAFRRIGRWVSQKLAKRLSRLTGDSPYATGAGSPELYQQYERTVAALMREGGFERREVALKKGQAFIWSSNLFHGGSPIRTPGRSRHSQVTHYYFERCMYFTPLMSAPQLGKFYMRKVRHIGTGELVPQFYNGLEIDTDAFND